MTPQLAGDLATLRQARIYFYHHSVGENVLAGIQQLDAEAGGGRLNFTSVAEAARVQGPVLAHGWGGLNKLPKTKIDFFAATLRGERGLNADLAMMKFCYVDFNPRTDVDDLLAYYKRTLDALKLENPGTRFAHVTVPLTARPTDLRSRARRLLGLEVWEEAANAKRIEFSRKVKEAFPSDPVFDLASVEARGPDGVETTSEHAGKRYLSLYPGYTEDGGHLNASGQRTAGAAAVRFVADALRTRRAQR
jgi:hypothetical protein